MLVVLVVALAVYSAWSLQRIVKRRKRNRGKCSGCPYRGTDLCR